MIQNHVVLALMKTWIQKVLQAERGLTRGFVIKVDYPEWYLKYVFQRGKSHLKRCRQNLLGSAKQEPGDPTSHDNGKVFLEGSRPDPAGSRRQAGRRKGGAIQIFMNYHRLTAKS